MSGEAAETWSRGRAENDSDIILTDQRVRLRPKRSVQLPQAIGACNSNTGVIERKVGALLCYAGRRKSLKTAGGKLTLAQSVDYEKFSGQAKKGFRFALKPVRIGRLASSDRPVIAGAQLSIKIIEIQEETKDDP